MNVCRVVCSHTHTSSLLCSLLLLLLFFSFHCLPPPSFRCLFHTSITLDFVDVGVVVGAILLSNSALYKSYTTPSMHRVVGGSSVCICWCFVGMNSCVFMYVCMCPVRCLSSPSCSGCSVSFSQFSIRGSWFLKI